MRILILFLLVFLSFDVYAEENSTGFFAIFGAIENFFIDIFIFITVVIPEKITEFIFWFKLFIAYMQFSLMLDTLRFSHDVALTLIDSLNINDVIDVAISKVPSDIRQAAIEMRFFEALNLIVEALITRFLYSIITR
jgi:hypothetical protein